MLDKLSDLSEDYYYKNYGDERKAMNEAAYAGGKLATTGTEAATNAYRAGGALDLAGLAARNTALGGLESLGTRAAIRTS